MTLASTRQLHSQGPVSVHAHRTKGGTGSEGRKGANGIRGRIGDMGGNGDGNGVEGGNMDGARTKMEVKANEGNGDWSGDGVEMRTGTGVETRRRSQDGNRDGTSKNGN